MEIRESAFDTGAVILNYAEVPSRGTPLVLLHGGNARWRGSRASSAPAGPANSRATGRSEPCSPQRTQGASGHSP